MASYDANAAAAAARQGQQDFGYQPTMADALVDLGLRTLFDFVQRALASPIDRLMVLTATEGELVRQGRLPSFGFGGIWGCVRRVWRKEGVAGFFRGVGADFVLSLPSGFVDALSTNAVFFLLQRALPERFANNMTYAQVVMVSMVASAASVMLAAPYNALRKSVMTNYMADIVAPVRVGGGTAKAPASTPAPGAAEGKEGEEEGNGEVSSPLTEGYRYTTAAEAARTIRRRNGWAAFYRAAAVDPIVICAYRGIYVATIALVSPDLQLLYPSAVARGMAVVADLLTQPLEVVTRRLLLTASDDAATAPYTGPVDCARSIVESEGITALWSGLKFRLLSSAMMAVLQFVFSGGGDGMAA